MEDRGIMEDQIKQALHTIEEQRGVRILYACEAGSRAYGIENQGSDYDVRFLYVRQRAHYLTLDQHRDVIEIKDGDLDIVGWDVFKALRLLRKSNPALIEWLFSSTIYIESSPVIAKMRCIATSLIAPTGNLYAHYGHMARGNYRQYIKDKPSVPLKKYLHVIRPLMMLIYLEQHGNFPVTTRFLAILPSVRDSIPDEVHDRITSLVCSKCGGEELGTTAPDPILNAFIDECLDRWAKQENTIGSGYDCEAMRRETEQLLQAVFEEEVTYDNAL